MAHNLNTVMQDGSSLLTEVYKHLKPIVFLGNKSGFYGTIRFSGDERNLIEDEFQHVMEKLRT
ncbi:hypothetical protein ABVN80_16640 [Acinetobacter baumannii]